MAMHKAFSEFWLSGHRTFRVAPIGPTTNTFVIITWVVAFIVSVGLGDFTAKKARDGSQT